VLFSRSCSCSDGSCKVCRAHVKDDKFVSARPRRFTDPYADIDERKLNEYWDAQEIPDYHDIGNHMNNRSPIADFYLFENVYYGTVVR
jgi:hypothetical protein